MEFKEFQQIVESNSRSIQALSESNSQAILTLTESTNRSIQALSNRISEVHSEAAAERRELREATLRVTLLTEGIAKLVVSLNDDRPTILGRLSRIENKVDQLLQRKNHSDAQES